MPMPKHINLSERNEARLREWLDYWLKEIEDRVQARASDWIKWRQAYEGKLPGKTFPWPGASNVHTGMTGTQTDAIHANLMNRVMGFDRLWDVHPVPGKSATTIGIDAKTGQPITWTTVADAAGEFLAFYASDNGPMKAVEVVNGWGLEALKLGTSIMWCPWLTLEQTDFSFNYDTGEVLKKVSRVVADGVMPQLIPLEDFTIMPGYHQVHGPNAAPLVGHYFMLRAGQLRAYEQAGQYRKSAVDNILGTPGTEYTASEEVKDAQDTSEGETMVTSDARRDDYKMWDGWIDFDVNDDGIEERLYVTYHKPTGSFGRVMPWIYKSRPYVAGRFITRENRFYGIGLPELINVLQSAVNTMYNQTIDNATLANTRWFKVRRGSFAAKHFDKVYPMAKILVDNPEDITGEQLGEVYPSSFELVRSMQLNAERRSGINDFNLGNDANAKMPATSAMALMQEAARRFDHYARDMRRALAEMGMQTLELIQQHKPSGLVYAVMGEKGELLEKTVLLPADANLREILTVTTTSAASTSNKEIARQNAVTGFGIVTQYLEKMAQLGQVMISPQAPPSFREWSYKAGEVGERLMKRILDTLDLKDIGEFLPQTEAMYAEGNAAPPPGLPGAGGGPDGMGGGEMGGGGPPDGGGGGLPIGPGMEGPEEDLGGGPGPAGFPPGPEGGGPPGGGRPFRPASAAR